MNPFSPVTGETHHQPTDNNNQAAGMVSDRTGIPPVAGESPSLNA